jgi:dTDP-4-amino-4,6-dideoxygalactose transaminase
MALAALAAARGRSEVVVPAYTCFSVPASAVAAGLRVRLVDVDERGRIDLGALAKLPLERAAAVVVCNLFGVPEPTSGVLRLARAAGAAVVDDAAQCLGARTDEGAVGARADVGLLSFARGKPLAALGGGAVLLGAPELHGLAREAPRTGIGVRARTGALLRAAAYALARRPYLFGHLASLPFLGIGETPFEPGFGRGPMAGPSFVLAAAAARELEGARVARCARALALARAVEGASAFRALLADPPVAGAYPRLALQAPSAAARAAALAGLDAIGAGASPFYPTALDAVGGLAPHLAAGTHVPGARDLAARILTLPTHGGLDGRREARALAVLAAAAAGGSRA